MKKILIIASAHMDLVSYVKALPQGNEDIEVIRQMQRVGGAGFKAAKIFQQLGVAYELLAPVGEGVYGEYVQACMEKEDIPLQCTTNMLSGCTYHMIDQKGNQTYFSVPGGEYGFDPEYVQGIDTDDISAVLLYGEMLSGEGTIDLLNVLDDLGKKIYFVPGEFGDQMDEDVFRALAALNPILMLTETDAYYLANERYHDFRMMAEYLYKTTNSSVMVFKPDEGIYWYDEEKFMLPSRLNGDFELLTAVFVLAQAVGVDIKNSMTFTDEFIRRSETEADDLIFEEAKRRLAAMITYK